MEPLTVAQADAIYDVLVRHAGARENERSNFVILQTDQPCREYRFIGSLGFGGKFWRSPDPGAGKGAERWYVTAYAETTRAQPQLWDVINRTNAALDALRRQYVEAA